MPQTPFSFIHSGDWELDQPPTGLADVPEHLGDVLAGAPLVAAARVFDAVLAEGAAFLALSGNVLDPTRSSPAVLRFLLDQFERMRQHHVRVYWAGGVSDSPDKWPEALPLPDNVYVFPASTIDRVTHTRDAAPLATLVGQSSSAAHASRKIRTGDFHRDDAAPCTIAIACGQADAEALSRSGITYWALGGQPDRHTVVSGPTTALYCGTPQGRCPAHTGTHGCTVVGIDDAGRVRTRAVITQSIRWHNETVTLPDDASRDDLELALLERMQTLADGTLQDHLLIRCTIRGAAGLGPLMRHRGLLDELQDHLRKEYGHRTPAAWLVSLDHAPPEKLPEDWLEEDTLLGDFLRLVAECTAGEEHPPDLENYLPEKLRDGITADPAELGDAPRRRQVLREVAALGADLLRADGPLEKLENVT